jgi:hypothetical protein
LTKAFILGIIISEQKKRRFYMAASKNARTTITTQKFLCSCGGEIVMKTLFENGRQKNVAECEKCKRTERRPKDFR